LRLTQPSTGKGPAHVWTLLRCRRDEKGPKIGGRIFVIIRGAQCGGVASSEVHRARQEIRFAGERTECSVDSLQMRNAVHRRE
jgi:hypothetical protein